MSMYNLGVSGKRELAEASYEQTPSEFIDHYIPCRIHMSMTANRLPVS